MISLHQAMQDLEKVNKPTYIYRSAKGRYKVRFHPFGSLGNGTVTEASTLALAIHRAVVREKRRG